MEPESSCRNGARRDGAPMGKGRGKGVISCYISSNGTVPGSDADADSDTGRGTNSANGNGNRLRSIDSTSGAPLLACPDAFDFNASVKENGINDYDDGDYSEYEYDCADQAHGAENQDAQCGACDASADGAACNGCQAQPAMISDPIVVHDANFDYYAPPAREPDALQQSSINAEHFHVSCPTLPLANGDCNNIINTFSAAYATTDTLHPASLATAHVSASCPHPPENTLTDFVAVRSTPLRSSPSHSPLHPQSQLDSFYESPTMPPVSPPRDHTAHGFKVNFQTAQSQAIPPRMSTCPVYYPTSSDFSNLLAFISKNIREITAHGICKIMLPPDFNPDKSIFLQQLHNFHFRSRVQISRFDDNIKNISSFGVQLNMGDQDEDKTKKKKQLLCTNTANLIPPTPDYFSWGPQPRNFTDRVLWVLKNLGLTANYNIPRVQGRLLDLEKLHFVVYNHGGPETVSVHKHWSIICQEMGFHPTSSIANSVKAHYMKFLVPYDEYRAARGLTYDTPPPPDSLISASEAKPSDSTQESEDKGVCDSVKTTFTIGNDFYNLAYQRLILDNYTSTGIKTLRGNNYIVPQSRPISPLYGIVQSQWICSSNCNIKKGPQSVFPETRRTDYENKAALKKMQISLPSVFKSLNKMAQSNGNKRDLLCFSSLQDFETQSQKLKQALFTCPSSLSFDRLKSEIENKIQKIEAACPNKHEKPCALVRVHEHEFEEEFWSFVNNVNLKSNHESGYNVVLVPPNNDLERAIPCGGVFTAQSLPGCALTSGFASIEDETQKIARDAAFSQANNAENQGIDLDVDIDGTDFCFSSNYVSSQNRSTALHMMHLPSLYTCPISVLSRASSDTKEIGSIKEPMISATTQNQINIEMAFSHSDWTTDDHFLPLISYRHLGDTKTWYAIPSSEYDKVRELFGVLRPETENPESTDQRLPTPSELVAAGIKVTVCRQREREIVVTAPKCTYSTISHGYGVCETARFASADWLGHGLEYAKMCKHLALPTDFSYDEILFKTMLDIIPTITPSLWLAPALLNLLERAKQEHELLLLPNFVFAQPGSLKSIDSLPTWLTRQQTSASHLTGAASLNHSSSSAKMIISSPPTECLDDVLEPCTRRCSVCCQFCWYAYLECPLHCGPVVCAEHMWQAPCSCPLNKLKAYYRIHFEALEKLVTRVTKSSSAPQNAVTDLRMKLARHASGVQQVSQRDLSNWLQTAESILCYIDETLHLRSFLQRTQEWLEAVNQKLKPALRKQGSAAQILSSTSTQPPLSTLQNSSGARATSQGGAISAGLSSQFQASAHQGLDKRTNFGQQLGIQTHLKTYRSYPNLELLLNSSSNLVKKRLRQDLDYYHAQGLQLGIYIPEFRMIDESMEAAKQLDTVGAALMMQFTKFIVPPEENELALSEDRLPEYQTAGQDQFIEAARAHLDRCMSFEFGAGYFDEIALFVLGLEWRRKIHPGLCKEGSAIPELIAESLKLKISSEDASLQWLQKILNIGKQWNQEAETLVATKKFKFEDLERLYHSGPGAPVDPTLFAKITTLYNHLTSVIENVRELFEESGKEGAAKPGSRTSSMLHKQRSLLRDLPIEKPPFLNEIEEELAKNTQWIKDAIETYKANVVTGSPADLASAKGLDALLTDSLANVEFTCDVKSDELVPLDSPNRRMFCFCRRSESGSMVGCEICGEFYHCNCIKINRRDARRLVYVCPVCDANKPVPHRNGPDVPVSVSCIFAPQPQSPDKDLQPERINFNIVNDESDAIVHIPSPFMWIKNPENNTSEPPALCKTKTVPAEIMDNNVQTVAGNSSLEKNFSLPTLEKVRAILIRGKETLRFAPPELNVLSRIVSRVETLQNAIQANILNGDSNTLTSNDAQRVKFFLRKALACDVLIPEVSFLREILNRIAPLDYTRERMCLCQRPYSELTSIISCDECDEWFHCPCVNLLPPLLRDLTYFVCPYCCYVARKEYPFGPIIIPATYPLILKSHAPPVKTRKRRMPSLPQDAETAEPDSIQGQEPGTISNKGNSKQASKAKRSRINSATQKQAQAENGANNVTDLQITGDQQIQQFQLSLLHNQIHPPDHHDLISKCLSLPVEQIEPQTTPSILTSPCTLGPVAQNTEVPSQFSSLRRAQFKVTIQVKGASKKAKPTDNPETKAKGDVPQSPQHIASPPHTPLGFPASPAPIESPHFASEPSQITEYITSRNNTVSVSEPNTPF